ncbi:hypothetical protein [Haloarcula nitratireducens]|uniref:Uncharacterized protein n=1 Tax=Haloarcula nitratireducens TaxID=2487749 RepID=A0AAW4PB56_9EURY|nr:hypothetical protein [Halomicroarcula nitratireducens]MBX0295356.1 hypothetical protein [Halomicroarcula nitratireducens]
MAFRLLLLVIGLVELLAPKKMVDFWMGLASKDDDVELRPWVYSVARLEGAVIVLWVLKRRRGRGKAE